jgi:hypothetical protein
VFRVNVEARLLELECRLWQAGGNRAAYARELASDAVHVFPSFGIVDRDTALDGVEGARPWARFTIDDARYVPLGDEAAALVYTATAQRDGDAPYTAAITSVYRRDGERWRLVLHQQTPLDGREEAE